uniref:Uncharacterized protein n=1 Tax=viral metagenome TaxID=1070528 RepID=A0A6C0J4B8_9ZZZZ
MEKISILVKTKESSIEHILPFGKYLLFSEINSGLVKSTTWNNYIVFVRKLYTYLRIPISTGDLQSEKFYWERLSDVKVMNKIKRIILTKFQIQDGRSMASKLSPIRAIMMRISHIIPKSVTSSWINMIIDCRNNFNNIAEHMEIIPYVPMSKKNIPGSWNEAYIVLNTISYNKTVDPRVRLVCILYKYGYIFRISTIIRTILQDTDNVALIPVETENDNDDVIRRRKSNIFNTKTNTWTIYSNEVPKCTFIVNKNMVTELKVILQDKLFDQGWLLPCKNGTPYSYDASVSSFSSWTKLGLHTYSTYKKLYVLWLKLQNAQGNINDVNIEDMIKIIDHSTTFKTITFIPPIPNDIFVKNE